MSGDTFKTIAGVSEGLYKDKGSRFLSFAWPVYSESEVKDKLLETKQRYHDARHHSYAYQLGLTGDQYRSNDDGEPSGTAGKPIHRQIQSFGLTNILVVVVRYFGGILLGTSGLIEAYRSAARIALENAIIIEKSIEHRYRIGFDYVHMNAIMKIVRQDEAEIITRDFGEKASMEVSIRQSRSKSFIERLKQLTGCMVTPIDKV